MLGLGSGLIRSGSIKGFQPTDIANLVMWFSHAEGTTYDDADDLITCWAAKVGSFYGVPTSVTDGSPGNDRPTHNATHIAFDGGDDIDFYDACSSGSTTSLTLDTSNGGYTVIGIYTDADWNGAQQALVGKISGSQDFIRHDVTNDRYEIKINNNLKIIDLDSALTDNQYYSIMLTHESDGTLTLYVNNVAQADTESLQATNDLTISAIGQRSTADRLSGKIKHVLAYDKALNEAQRDLIQAWAATQF